MAGLIDFINKGKRKFVEGMEAAEQFGRKYLSNPTFGPKTTDQMKLRAKRLMQAGIEPGETQAAPEQPQVPFKKKESMKRKTMRK